MGVVLTLPGEGSVLGRLSWRLRLDQGDSQGRKLEMELPAPRTGARSWGDASNPNIPESLDIGVSGGWGLTFDQTIVYNSESKTDGDGDDILGTSQAC